MPARNEIANTSKAIANLQAEDVFEREWIVEPAAGSKVYPISLTSVYMIPGRSTPRLHKVVDEPNPTIQRDIRDTAVALTVGTVSNKLARLHNDSLRSIASNVIDACEDMEARDDTRGKPFRTLGLTAVYLTDTGSPFACAFADRTFVEALAERAPSTPPISEMPDEIFRELYMRQSEQDIDIAPYDQWKETAADTSMDAGSDEARRYDSAIGIVNMLTLPRDNTEPVLNVKLF